MPVFRKADRDVYERMRDLMRQYHPDLRAADVMVCVLYAQSKENPSTGEPAGPPLKDDGRPVLAQVKINSTRNRVEGMADATVALDVLAWQELPVEEQDGALDGCLMRLSLVRDENGAPEVDDANRPKLVKRLPDFVVQGFYEVVQRHGVHAPEAIAWRELHRQFTQRGLFPTEEGVEGLRAGDARGGW